ncbi:MAG: efflux RND transporter permease subunit, partial [Candidatus Pacebacteria bacterium]|nr:efflux RND transporter permease subunit [Candidatus Paceibacterota bacterium]
YGISSAQADQAIAAAKTTIPSGNFDSGIFTIPVHTDLPFTTAADIANIPVLHTADGSVIYVRDIAAVTETSVKKSVYSRLSIGGAAPSNSISLSLIKRQGASVLDTLDTAKATVDKMVKALPPGITYNVTMDMAKQVRDDFTELSNDFLLTILLVGIILFLVVGVKEAFVAGLAIPLVFFVTFGTLYMLGYTLNFLSLFSLILALGLLVDDAIVVVSATKQYLNTGKFTPEEAVLLVLNDFKWVLTTTTLATVWAFLPLLFASGIIGQYLKSIPVTVSITLVSSLLIALIINHPLAAVLERIRLTKAFFYIIEAIVIASAAALFYFGGWPAYVAGAVLVFIESWLIWWYEKGGKEKVVENAALMEKEWESDDLIKAKLRQQGSREHENLTGKLLHGIVNFHRILPFYEKSLRYYIVNKTRRRLVLAAVGLLFIGSVALVVTGVVQSVFFPTQDSDYVYIDMRAPVGTNLDETNARTKTIESELLANPDVKKNVANMSTEIGAASAASGSFGGGGPASTNLSNITLSLKDKSIRPLKSYQLSDKIRAFLASTTNLVVDVSVPAGGPPAGAAFEAHIAGDDLDTLTTIVNQLRPMLASIPGAINVEVSQKESVPEYTFMLDPTRLEENGLTAASVGMALRTAISGNDLVKVNVADKEIQLTTTFDQNALPDLASIQNLQILNNQNKPVYLKDVSTIVLEPSVDVITRIDQKRTIVLSAGADSSTNGQAILGAFQKKLASFDMPAGYSVTYGGENQQNAESVASVLRAMVIALLLIVAT